MKCILILTIAIGCIESLGLPSNEEIDLLIFRRVNNLVSHYNTSPKNAEKWASALNKTTGTWPTIDYASGCEAR
ncbi:hypothetical protein BY458DRAFT_525805 [Sporodiniella umbellata]|nr:hypothetical protein BY458DRAFT_525805 [Sporodiniella umbellata]